MVQITHVSKAEPSTDPGPPAALGSHITVVKAEGDRSVDAIAASSIEEAEEVWKSHYYHPLDAKQNQVLPPPYDPVRLGRFIEQNNTLNQCIAAYEVNIAGTGYVIEAKDPKEQADLEEQAAEVRDFFEEVFPCVSWTTVNRFLRRDQEALGNAYLEVMRDLKGDIAFLRNADSQRIRLLKLDKAVLVNVTLERFGQKKTVKTLKRERRYAQMLGKRMVYFREFGSSRHINKRTGEWETAEKPIDPRDRGNELIHLYPQLSAGSPYGIPRWINNLPSVLGSRQAEEFNLRFFDCGGIPPAIITVAGGSIAEGVRKQLQAYLSGKGGPTHRAVIVEAFAATGAIDGTGSVSINVERFGSERQSDSMFEKYDANCHTRVRGAFRLPPLLVGKADDYTLATAFASYVVAEAQVFKPERDEQDQVMNTKIMREIAPAFVIRSLGVQVKDVTQQLNGLRLIEKCLTKGELVEQVNEVCSLAATVAEGTEDDPVGKSTTLEQIAGSLAQTGAGVGAQGAGEVAAGTQAITGGKEVAANEPAVAGNSVVTKFAPDQFMQMAKAWAYQITANEVDPNVVQQIHQQVAEMSVEEQQLFSGYVSANLMSDLGHDPAGAQELMQAAGEIIGCACEIA